MKKRLTKLIKAFAEWNIRRCEEQARKMIEETTNVEARGGKLWLIVNGEADAIFTEGTTVSTVLNSIEAKKQTRMEYYKNRKS